MIAELERLQTKLEPVEITIDDLVQWKNHPVTKHLTKNFLEAYLEELEFISTNIPTNDDTRALHASTVGKLDVYKTFLDYVEDNKAELKGNDNNGD